jgi:SAM-dependent methyltransferase
MRQEIENAKESLRRFYNAEYLYETMIPPVRSILEALCLQPDDIIVDFGSDVGHFSLPIASYFEKAGGSGVVFAFDFTKEFIETLDKRAASQGLDIHIRTVCLSEVMYHTLPLADECVESVLAVNSIHYLPDPVPYLQEIARILKPCGSLLMADWKHGINGDSTAITSPPISPDDLYPKLEAAGLDAHISFNLDGYTWGIRAMKPIVFS